LVECVFVKIGGEFQVLMGQLILLERSGQLCDDLLGNPVVELLDLVELNFHC
jgi:hypothetical protein